MSRSLVLIVLVASLAAGCKPSNPMPYDLERPAQVLAPIGVVGVDDDRPRFRRIFSERLEASGSVPDPGTEMFLHRLGDEGDVAPPSDPDLLPVERLVVQFVPGYLGKMAPGGMMPFQSTIAALREAGHRIDYVDVSAAGSSTQNGSMIDDALRGLELDPQDTLVLIGYSKGVTDIMHFLIDYPETAARVDGVLGISGVVNGTPLADMYPEILPNFIAMVAGTDTGDYGGMGSLRRSRQMPWLAANPMPEHPRYYSLGSFARYSNISKMLQAGWEDLARVDPMNDSQVIFTDQILPNSTLLGFVNADHWAVALPFTELAPGMTGLVDKNEFPRKPLFEALILYLREDFAG